MKAGLPVRVRVPGQRRLLRGVVIGPAEAPACGWSPEVSMWKIRVGLRHLIAERAALTVVRKPAERMLVLARDQALRAEVRFLAGALQGRRGAIA